MSFDSLGLSAALLRAVSEEGYTQPTPVQAQVIPVVLQGRDVMAGAQTGTGKTAGFTLPMLELLSAAPAGGYRHLRALILTPTRELAAQVAASVQRYGKHLPLKSTVVFGGVNINPQTAALRRGVDILIATPGRLLDHASQGNVDLSRVEILVLDEADRMLDMGFLPDIRRIIALLPPKRQNLLFSATFPDDIRTLANKMLNSPMRIEVARRNAAADHVEQIVHLAEKNQKRGMLSWLISSGNWRQVLVFTRTKHGANRLAQQLEQDGLRAAAIHGNKSQGARTKALADFKQGSVRILVATDIASRGLDIDQLPHVVNYELPDVPEYYVHRIGRTGRAGREGIAVSLVSNDERPMLQVIERLLGYRIPQQPVTGYQARPASQEPAREPQTQRRHYVKSDGRSRAGQGPAHQANGRKPQGRNSSQAGQRDQSGSGGKSRAGRRRRAAARAAAGRP